MFSRPLRLVALAAAALALALAMPTPAFAQSSWGVAVTATRDVIFCDVRRDRVMRFSPDGALTEVLADTHCRSLALAPDGFVYGESAGRASQVDVTTGTSTTNLFGVWRTGLSGHAWIQPPAPAPDPAIWIVIDDQGRSYGWNGALPRTTLSQIVRRERAGVVTVAGGAWGQLDGVGTGALFGRVAGMALAPDGTLVVADSGNIRRVALDGRVTTESLRTVTDADSGVPSRLGLWDRVVGVATDADGSAVVVDLPARRIARIARDGSAREIWRSNGWASAISGSRWGWRPTGVAMTPTGFYVLEDWPLPSFAADLVGSPRVLFVNRDGSSKTVVSVSSMMLRGLTGLSLVIVFSAIRSAIQARRRRSRGLTITP